MSRLKMFRLIFNFQRLNINFVSLLLTGVLVCPPIFAQQDFLVGLPP